MATNSRLASTLPASAASPSLCHSPPGRSSVPDRSTLSGSAMGGATVVVSDAAVAASDMAAIASSSAPTRLAAIRKASSGASPRAGEFADLVSQATLKLVVGDLTPPAIDQDFELVVDVGKLSAGGAGPGPGRLPIARTSRVE